MSFQQAAKHSDGPDELRGENYEAVVGWRLCGEEMKME